KMKVTSFGESSLSSSSSPNVSSSNFDIVGSSNLQSKAHNTGSFQSVLLRSSSSSEAELSNKLGVFVDPKKNSGGSFSFTTIQDNKSDSTSHDSNNSSSNSEVRSSSSSSNSDVRSSSS